MSDICLQTCGAFGFESRCGVFFASTNILWATRRMWGRSAPPNLGIRTKSGSDLDGPRPHKTLTIIELYCWDQKSTRFGPFKVLCRGRWWNRSTKIEVGSSLALVLTVLREWFSSFNLRYSRFVSKVFGRSLWSTGSWRIWTDWWNVTCFGVLSQFYCDLDFEACTSTPGEIKFFRIRPFGILVSKVFGGLVN